MADEPLHDFPDRAFRKVLQHPDNLRALLAEVVPDLAGGFDFARARLLPRDFLLDDWRGRESDLLFEIPYRAGAEDQTALVCVLVEHQSTADPRMPLRTLIYAVLYWERQWKEWEQAAGERPPFRLTPVVPIILHTATRRWGSARELAEMLAGPEAFRAFAPRWRPIFWELADHSSQELLNSQEAFLQLLAVARVEDEDATAFEAAFTEALRKLERLHGEDRVKWYDMLNAVLTWAWWRRPTQERPHWQAVAETIHNDADRKREVQAMGKTIAQAVIEEAQVAFARETLLQLGRKHIGEPSDEAEGAVNELADLNRLRRMIDRASDVDTWEELLETQ